MTAPTHWYVNGIRTCMRAGCGIAGVTGTLKFMLLNATHAPDLKNHIFVTSVSAAQASGTGYTAGGITIVTPTVTADGATNSAFLDFNDVTGLSVTGCYGALYVDTGTAATSPLLTLTDFSEGTAVDQVLTNLVVATNGHAALTAA